MNRRISLLIAFAATAATASASAVGQPWVAGDVFVGVANGSYQVYSNAGVFKQTISDGMGGFTTGGAFSASAKLYTTNINASRVVVYDGSPPHGILQNIDTTLQGGAAAESIIFDSSGNFYVGHAGGNTDIQKYDSAGVFQTSYDVAIENVGSDWIDISSDQMTMFHTSEGRRVMRFDLAGNAQLADFALLPGDGGQAFAFRLLGPNFDGSNGLIVADRTNIKRLDSGGNVSQSYDVTGEDNWFAMNLDPNGASFWAADFGTSNFYRFNIASGAVEVGPINTGTATFTVFGLIVAGELGGGNEQPTFDHPPTPTCGGTINATFGLAMSFTVQASDNTPNDVVTLSATGLPATATMTPPLPTAGNPVSSVFNWTPDLPGLSAITFTATDLAGHAVDCVINIDVVIPQPEGFCFGDDPGFPCPCANNGAAGNGCANSDHPGGANLSASGSASLSNDTLVLTVTDQHASALTLVWQGDTEIPPVANGDGLRCLDGLRRMYRVKNLHATTASVPPGTGPAESVSVSQRSADLGDPLSPGSVRGYYATYRDPPNFACPSPATINNTNALRIVWGP